ncbi:hypothetical protein TI39_contig600g00009 [Zymoseptoria brevis]|uniref:Methyltransferase type 11 domain-containing protein n=1 Tax=Zymoseptoria brevis TaxID=1047168 RepID=A0A0F4GHD8_9PEZI|nr:hypothetical protein TI39_contig600g00009 [Zymoseptoria brevis]
MSTATRSTDIAPQMLSNLQSRKLPNVTTSILDASRDHVSQGLQPESFTHTLSTFLLQFLPDPQHTVNEMHRLLASGGVFGSTVWSKAQIAESWNGACSNLDSTFEPNDAAFASAWGSQDLEQGLKKAGFVDVRSEE